MHLRGERLLIGWRHLLMLALGLLVIEALVPTGFRRRRGATAKPLAVERAA